MILIWYKTQRDWIEHDEMCPCPTKELYEFIGDLFKGTHLCVVEVGTQKGLGLERLKVATYSERWTGSAKETTGSGMTLLPGLITVISSDC